MTTLEKIKNITYFNLVNKIKEVLAEMLDNTPSQGIEEAPLDGKEYVRKSGEWVEATSGE